MVSKNVRLTRGIFIPPLSQSQHFVANDESRLLFLQNRSKMASKKLALIDNSIMSLLPEAPFWTLISNFEANPVKLPKNPFGATRAIGNTRGRLRIYG